MHAAAQNYEEAPEHTEAPPGADDELGLIVDVLPGWIARLDAEERHVFGNQAYADWFGLRPEALRRQSLRAVLGPKTYPCFQPHIRAALAGQRRPFEATVSHHSLGERFVRVQCVPRFGPAGAVRGIYLVIADVTEQHDAESRIHRLSSEMEQRVQERTAQLESTNKELEAFCYSVSHDLRAPLRAVRGFGDVLLEQYLTQLDGRGQELLRRTCQASAHMDRLVEDLLKLSRVSRGEMRTDTVNLSAIAQEIASELLKAEPSREADFAIAPDLAAQGDGRLLRVVLDNLLRNAWKFTSGRRRARIEFGRSGGDTPAFFVRDNGAGFDMNYAGKLFGVFQRLHSTSDFPGSGVGLAIVQRIINRHGGRTWGVGEVDRGATFYFTLPAANPR
jgi:PAS domain S-box-containing protein